MSGQTVHLSNLLGGFILNVTFWLQLGQNPTFGQKKSKNSLKTVFGFIANPDGQ